MSKALEINKLPAVENGYRPPKRFYKVEYKYDWSSHPMTGIFLAERLEDVKYYITKMESAEFIEWDNATYKDLMEVSWIQEI